MGQFDKVDLGNDKTMQRMVKQEKDKRNTIIEECASLIENDDFQLAERIRDLKTI